MKREEGRIWHWLDAPELPGEGVEVAGELDWARRHLLMRTQIPQHDRQHPPVEYETLHYRQNTPAEQPSAGNQPFTEIRRFDVVV